MSDLEFKSEQDQIRFESKIDKSGECHLWLAATWSKGYGQFTLNGKNHRAHRVSYQNYNDNVGDMQVLHKCDNPRCVNPEHLFLGTNSDNRKDSYDKGRGNFGSKNGMSSLTSEQVSEIKFATGTYKDIAFRYLVSPQTVGRIKRGETYVG